MHGLPFFALYNKKVDMNSLLLPLLERFLHSPAHTNGIKIWGIFLSRYKNHRRNTPSICCFKHVLCGCLSLHYHYYYYHYHCYSVLFCLFTRTVITIIIISIDTIAGTIIP